MIRQANTKDIEPIKILWKEIFEDSDEFLSLFFEKIFRKENCLVAVNDENKLCAALQLLPYSFVVKGKTITASYIYAIMTAPDERKKGYMDSLLKSAFEILRERNIPLVFLIPQEEYLIPVYEKYGFQQAFRKRKEIVSLPDFPVKSFSPSIDECYRFYQDFYQSVDGVKLSFRQFEFICQDLKNEGGQIIAVSENNEINALCLAKTDNEQLLTLDFLAINKNARQNLLAALSHQFSQKEAVISYWNNGDMFTGMAKITDDTQISFADLKHSYLSLLMEK